MAEKKLFARPSTQTTMQQPAVESDLKSANKGHMGKSTADQDVRTDPGIEALLKARADRVNLKPNMAKMVITRNLREQPRAKSSTDKTFDGIRDSMPAAANYLDPEVALDQPMMINRQSQFGESGLHAPHSGSSAGMGLNLMKSSPI